MGSRSSVGSASDTRSRGPGFDTRSGHILSFLLPLIQEGQLKNVHEVLVNSIGGLSLPGKKEVRLTDRPDMTIDVYRGRESTTHNMTNMAMSVHGKTLNLFFCGTSGPIALRFDI